MLQVKNLAVKSLDVDHLDLFWEIGDTYDDPHDYTFIVERSESPEGPWDQISEGFSDKYFFRDVMSRPFHRHRQLWYRIRITRISDSNVVYSDHATKQPDPDLTAQEVRRLEFLLLREHIGRVVWVFPVRTFGQRCRACYDKVSRTRTRSNCLTCYDTTYTRGFLDPIAVPIQIDPAPKVTQQTALTESQEQNATARAPYFPPLKPRDVIVEAENIRWQVVTVTETQRLRATLHYEITLHRIPESDIEYRLPINIDDLRTLQPSPGREFTNPHHLECAQGADLRTSMLKGHGHD